MREAYSHEVSSAGFWPGGNGTDYAAFYSYAYPTPAGFRERRGAARRRAFFSETLGEFLLPYDAVRTAADPDAALLAFLQSTYEAAAHAGAWDRAALECPQGLPGRASRSPPLRTSTSMTQSAYTSSLAGAPHDAIHARRLKRWHSRRRLAWRAAYAPARARRRGAPSQTQFGGQCAEALAEGRHVLTDCTITWTDKDGKTYCFSDDGAKKSFLENPADNLRARAQLRRRQQRRVHREGHAGLHRHRCRNAGQGTPSPTTLKANNGIFPFDDPLNGEHLKLTYDDIDFTRTIDGYGFFPDVKFHDSQGCAEEIPDRFLGHTAGRRAADSGNPHLQGTDPIRRKWTTMARQPIPVVVDTRLRTPRAISPPSAAGK